MTGQIMYGLKDPGRSFYSDPEGERLQNFEQKSDDLI